MLILPCGVMRNVHFYDYAVLDGVYHLPPLWPHDVSILFLVRVWFGGLCQSASEINAVPRAVDSLITMSLQSKKKKSAPKQKTGWS